MDTWPATLPQDFGANTTVTDDESRLISQMDAGPSSVRNRYTAITQTVKTSMILTGSQMDTFLTFFRTTLNHGALSFLWTHPVTGDQATIRFKKKPEWDCIRPSSISDSRLWKGSFELEILP